jgi:hypothetical protein
MTPRKLLLALGASGILLIGTVGTSLAGNVTTTGGVRSGPLTLTTTPTVSLSTTLDGSDLLVSGSLGASTVVDATGSGAGWRLTIAGTTFKSAAGKTLPADALTITGVTVVKNSGKSPTNTTSYPVTVPMAATAPAAVKFAAAAADSGMGRFTVTPAIALEVPADAYAGDYASTLTISIVSGP